MEKIQEIMEKKMTRKQFLISLGAICLTVTGISGIFKNLKDLDINGFRDEVGKGFGSGPYGV